MRFARALTLFLFAATPLAAQQPTVINQPTAEPLKATLHFTGYGLASYESNKPAYVALFDVTRDGLSQVYPASRYQSELATTFRYLNNGIARGYGGFRSPLFYSATYGWSGYQYGSYISATQWHTLLLVASTAPLKMGYALSNEIRLTNAMYRQGLGFRMDTDAGIEFIIKQIAPENTDAEVTMDWVDVPPSQYSMYGDYYANAYQNPCFSSFAFLGGYWPTGRCPMGWYWNPAAQFAPAQISVAKPVRPNVDTLAKVDGGKLSATAKADGKQQSPDEIRRIVQQLRDAEGGNIYAIDKLGGARTATRQGYNGDGGDSFGGPGRSRDNAGAGFHAPQSSHVAVVGPSPSVYHERTQTESPRGSFTSGGGFTGGSTGTGGSSAHGGGFSAPSAPVVAPTPSRPQVEVTSGGAKPKQQ